MGKKRFICCLILGLTFGTCGYSQRPQLVKEYRSQIGIRESSGKNDGRIVESYLTYVGLSKGNPWCSAFVSWCHGRVGLEIPKSGYSPNLFPPDHLIYSRNGLNKRQAATGDIFGIYFADKKRIAHVGFIDAARGDNYLTVEGNTNDAGSREGDGVYRKIRPKKTIYQISSFIKD